MQAQKIKRVLLLVVTDKSNLLAARAAAEARYVDKCDKCDLYLVIFYSLCFNIHGGNAIQLEAYILI